MWRRASLLALVLAAGAPAVVASAAWSSSASAGSQTVATATVEPPGALGATGNCKRNARNWVVLGWTASPSSFADGYEIFRATGGGSAVSIASVAAGTTGYTDKSVSHSTSYAYTVQTTHGSWRSASSNAASFTTPNNKCR